jgi:hypothetical protein
VKKKVFISLALIGLLLIAAVPAAATSPVTHFVTKAYVCGMDLPIKEWVTDDGILHQRGLVLHNEYVSDGEPRMVGVDASVLHQDIDLATGEIQAWGTGGIITDEGSWYYDLRAEANSDGFVSYGTGYGGDGLEGYFVSWTGRQIFPPYEDAPCETELAMELTGLIRPGKGPAP